MIDYNIDNIKVTQILHGSQDIPAYIEFFDSISKRTILQSIKTFKMRFNLSDDEVEKILKDNS